MDIQERIYQNERIQIVADLMSIQYEAFILENDSFSEGLFNNVKTGVSLANQGAKNARHKAVNNPVMDKIKEAIEKFVEMIVNLLKSLTNSHKKMVALLKEMEKAIYVENRQPRETGKNYKANKKIKTITDKSTNEMNLANLKPTLELINEMVVTGSTRQNLNFSNHEEARKSLTSALNVHANDKNAYNVAKKQKWSKYKSLEAFKNDHKKYGEAIKELYTITPIANKNHSKFEPLNTRTDKQNQKIASSQYFKQPKVYPVEIGENSEIIYTHLMDKDNGILTQLYTTMQGMVKLDMIKYLRDEEKLVKKARDQIKKLVNSKMVSDTTGETPSTANTTADLFKSKSENFDYIFDVLNEIKAYSEDDNTNKAANELEKQNQSEDKEETNKPKETELSDDRNEYKEIAPFLREFFVNYALAIHATSNLVNSYFANMNTIARRALNDFYVVTKK